MNTKAMFYPSVRMGKALRESKDEGTSRIEITYTALNAESEAEFFHPLFGRKAETDLNLAQAALDQVPVLCWRLPMIEMFNKFNEVARGHQLLIVQPSIAALIFAANSKPGCFTGFYKVAQPGRVFKYQDFLAAAALPGPQSIINCVIQQYGSAGPAKFVVVEKETALSTIPGLVYQLEAIANLPKPAAWDRS